VVRVTGCRLHPAPEDTGFRLAVIMSVEVPPINYNIYDFKTAINTVYEQLKEEQLTDTEYAENHATAVAYSIVDGDFNLPEPLSSNVSTYSYPQYMYYIEGLLTTPELVFSKQLSYHLYEDNTTIDGVIKDAFVNTIAEYIKAKHSENTPSNVEPTPETELPSSPVEPLAHKEFKEAITTAHEDTWDKIPYDITTNNHTEIAVYSERAEHNYRSTFHDEARNIWGEWSLTKQALFINYLRKHHSEYSQWTSIDIPPSQMSKRSENTIIRTMEKSTYWTVDSYLDGVLSIGAK